MTISAEQRAWLKDLGALVGEAPEKSPDEGGSKQQLVGGDDPKALFGLPFIPEVPLVTSRVTIKNKTNVALRIVSGSAKLENLQASFSKAPDIDISGPSDSDFIVTNESKVPLIPRAGGTGGEIRYDIVGDEKKAQLFLKWERGAIPDRGTKQSITPEDGRFKIAGVFSGDDFQFDFTPKGGTPPPGPGPNPVPGPVPAPNVPSSCLISVTNQTDLELTRAEAEHERGDFMVPPPRVVAANSTVTFASVETPGAKEQGCKGFVTWEVGSPAKTVWRIEWDNPEGAKNNSNATLVPPVTGLRSQDVIGQGEENVPVSFALSGQANVSPTPVPPTPVPPTPVPPTPVPPEPELPFEPPVKTKQPTFRLNDKSIDGWIEYAQMLLNFHLGTKLASDGVFGKATHAAILRFQKEKKLQVDGTLGNQTWAALREGAPEKPSTDGRTPHTFVEKGVEARWSTESDSFNFHFADTDEVLLSVNSVGDTPIDPSTQATVRVTPPGGKPKVVKVALGPGGANSPGEGALHSVTLKDFRKRFPSVPADAKVSDYLIEAFLPAELGGDLYSGKVKQA